MPKPLTEGMTKKGGVNQKPATPKPQIKPPPQQPPSQKYNRIVAQMQQVRADLMYENMKIVEYRARIDAVLCRVEGMKAANAARAQQGQAMGYHQESFTEAEREIEGWANSIMELCETIACMKSEMDEYV